MFRLKTGWTLPGAIIFLRAPFAARPRPRQAFTRISAGSSFATDLSSARPCLVSVSFKYTPAVCACSFRGRTGKLHWRNEPRLWQIFFHLCSIKPLLLQFRPASGFSDPAFSPDCFSSWRAPCPLDLLPELPAAARLASAAERALDRRFSPSA